MAIENLNSTEQQMLAAMFFGTAIAFILHGITSCQTVSFFRSQLGRSGRRETGLVIFVWLAEALNCTFVFVATLNMFFNPAIIYAAGHASPCSDWIARAQTIPSTMCTFTVEGFFIFRVWKLSEYNKLTMIAFIPFLTSYGFAMAQMVRSFRLRCIPGAVDINRVFVFSANICRILGDGVVVATMCYILYRRSSGFTTHTNTIKVVRGLILWSISTGVLTWITSLLYLLSVARVAPIGFTVYFIRGGLYANAMLAQLNARTRYRTMAQESIPLNSLSFRETSSSHVVDRELQPLDSA